MKTMFNKLSASFVLMLVILLGVMACKKSEEQLDSPTILSRLAGEDSTLWRFPSSLEEGCPDADQPLLLLRRDETYLYTQGSCSFKGSWSVTYTSNRSGQDITLELIDEEGGGGVRRVKLMYSRDNNAFYYVDPEKGLLLLTSEVIAASMSWVPKVFPTMPSTFLGRINTVSVAYGDIIYFGLGEDHTGTIAYNDWYSFDGTQFIKLADIGSYPIVNAKALVVGGKVYVVGGKFVEGSYMDNSLTYMYDPGKNSWETAYEEEGLQHRSNGVYLMFNSKEMLGLGSAPSLTGSNFYTRIAPGQPWTEIDMSPLTYGFAAHDYQDALYFPWNGGYFVGGGKMQASENLLDYSTSWIGNSIAELTTTPATPNNGLGFSEGMGVDMGNYSLVYGINTSGTGAAYSKYVYTLDHTGKWTAVLPTALPSEPVPGRSSVLWKIRNAQGKTEVYGGLGANPLSTLYQLKIQ